MNENVKDSGKTEEYESGAHRDDAIGKGMCNLLPLEYVSMVIHGDKKYLLLGGSIEKFY